jgi:hypothetical protein
VSPDHPILSAVECVTYLGRNAWQFNYLGPADSVRVNANVVRSVLFHMTVLEEDVPRLAVEGDV